MAIGGAGKMFIRDLKRYSKYATYSAVSELKSQVAGSYLGWMWWVLDPLLFMLVYTFVAAYIFGCEVDNFPLFVFLGLTVWNFFGSTVEGCVGIINSYSAVTKKAYIPKFILVLMKQFENLIKMLISVGISLVTIIVLQIPVTLNLLACIPILLVYFVLSFGVGTICAYLGVFVSDLSHVISIFMRFLFYLSAVFYPLDRFGEGLLNIYNMICPTGFIIVQFRNVMMYGFGADYFRLFYWLIIGLMLSVVGVSLLYRGEKDFMKVVF